MSTRFNAAAHAIAHYFRQLEAQRGMPFSDTFRNPMNRNALTPTSVGIPVALLRDLIACEESRGVTTSEFSTEGTFPGTGHSPEAS